MRIVGVIDIGKTNAKVAAVDLDRFEEVAVRKTANRVVAGEPYPHFDVERLWAFVLDSLTALQAEHPLQAISITTHGATAVVLDEAGDLALPVLDYEFVGPDTLSEAYEAVRPPFAETGSARLPMGLNVGAQLFWQQQTFPDAFARIATILTYAQYWTFRLTGVRVNELTSLGCHTDLWNPTEGAFSTLVEGQGWRHLFAPVRKADDIVGKLLPELCLATGIPAGTPIYCGIHDSNASLLPHLLTRTTPFSVVSTGTWVVMLAVGAAKVTLDEHRDTLINVNALGDPVPSARFMGGRAFSLLLGDGTTPTAFEDEEAVIAAGHMLLPSLPEGSGPFPSAKARWTVDEEKLTPAGRVAAVSFHLALMTATCLDLIGARGDIVVEGPFAANAAYLRMLQAATGRPVLADSHNVTGTSLGAASLVDGRHVRTGVQAFAGPVPESFVHYAENWRSLTKSHVQQANGNQ
ncbi:carbohydrate kinase [Ensifer sp. T173]|jgi:sugar (pentulose or hexulose) kinase|uniref:Carbohydrate kinase n=1 Tax=Ensifer canadensis TaxID=555315 RepID=A0AAW4FIQ1_9HYPH|nr:MULTISPECIES: FGGY-family carbohydrate kinase [Ensifer]KQW84898.1 carbohydrate kinase [Ensifer sp. Root127]MBD9486135.1 FGGY-family carbohydrate kinase [Ensifer sp. ENS11]MBM3091114.1 carbohydrate kinase [Ensifer canadensis]PSS66950.1 carbohydrate kinase [Ensifer sp. NM-2]UBI75831.1 FGGY-family carbohydrate kinase [Ensifer canadensis]